MRNTCKMAATDHLKAAPRKCRTTAQLGPRSLSCFQTLPSYTTSCAFTWHWKQARASWSAICHVSDVCWTAMARPLKTQRILKRRSKLCYSGRALRRTCSPRCPRPTWTSRFRRKSRPCVRGLLGSDAQRPISTLVASF